MDDAQIISIAAFEFQNAEDQQKYIMWRSGAYAPMLISRAPYAGIEFYEIVQGKTDYPFTFSISYFQNLEDRLDAIRTPEYAAYLKDLDNS